MLNLSSLRAALLEHIHPVTAAHPMPESEVRTRNLPTLPTPFTWALQRIYPWRSVILQATGMWLATRIALVAFTYFAVLFRFSGRVAGYLTISPHTLLHAWKQWDGEWYIQIANTGYGKVQATAFFPLYPGLIKLTVFFVGDHWMTAAMLASNFGTLLGFIGIALLATGEYRQSATTWSTIRVLAAYPLAFFLAAPYTEGFFLGFACLSLFCARRGSWRWAALWAFLASLTRPTGVVLLPALLWEFGRQHGWWDQTRWQHALEDLRAWIREPHRVEWLPSSREQWLAVAQNLRRREVMDCLFVLGAVPAALGLFMGFLWYQFGHPLLWYNVQRIYWRRHSMPIWNSLGGAIHQFFSMPAWSYWQARQLVDLAPVLLFALLTVLNIRRMPFSFSLYTLGLLYLALSSPVPVNPDPDYLMSAGRFLLVAAPIFLLLGRWSARRPWLDLLLVSGGFMLQAVLLTFFLSGGWLL